jgi:hypothetical protein
MNSENVSISKNNIICAEATKRYYGIIENEATSEVIMHTYDFFFKYLRVRENGTMFVDFTYSGLGSLL